MRNPFSELGHPRIKNPTGEEVEGTFGCQTYGCYKNVSVARYLTEASVLTWECPDGHINKIEGFNIG